MPFLGTPKYPVVDSDPSLTRALTNLNFTDAAYIVGLPSVGAAFGYLTARKPFRSYQLKFLGTVGLTAGIMVATLRSSQRLMGCMVNDEEIMAYGIMDKDKLAEARRRQAYNNLSLVDAEKKD